MVSDVGVDFFSFLELGVVGAFLHTFTSLVVVNMDSFWSLPPLVLGATINLALLCLAGPKHELLP